MVTFEQIAVSIVLILITGIIAFLVVMFLSGVISSLHGAPFVPIKKKLVKKLLDFGQISKDDSFYDLGSGDGRVLVSAVKEFAVKDATGYEVSLWPYLESRFLLWQNGLNKNAKAYHRNFFKINLSGANFIYMYLFPKLVDKLVYKIAGECQAGTKILCPSFPVELERHPEFRLLKSEKIGKITAYLYEKI